MYAICLTNSLLKLFSQTNQIKPSLKNICPKVRFWFVFLTLCRYIRHTYNATNMFQYIYISRNQFFKFCRNIAIVSIFCPDNSKSVIVSSKSNFYCNSRFKLKLLVNKIENNLQNIKFKLKFLVFVTKF